MNIYAFEENPNKKVRKLVKGRYLVHVVDRGAHSNISYVGNMDSKR